MLSAHVQCVIPLVKLIHVGCFSFNFYFYSFVGHTFIHLFDWPWRLSSFSMCLLFHSSCCLWLLLFDLLFHLPFWSEASIIASLNCHHSLLPHNMSAPQPPALCIVEHSDGLMSTGGPSLLCLICLLSPLCYGDLCYVNKWCPPYLRRLGRL